MEIADRAQSLQISLRRDEHTRRPRDRLDDDRGDRLRAMAQHDRLELVGEMRAPGGLSATERVVREVMCVWQMVDARKQLTDELLLVRVDAADGDAAESDAVIA